MEYPFSTAEKKSFASSPEYIHDDMIFSMTEDDAGNLWLGTKYFGLIPINNRLFR